MDAPEHIENFDSSYAVIIFPSWHLLSCHMRIR
jgi:hypothetical protein